LKQADTIDGLNRLEHVREIREQYQIAVRMLEDGVRLHLEKVFGYSGETITGLIESWRL
jgi:hypothetical protein